jgi:hypothetical protein
MKTPVLATSIVAACMLAASSAWAQEAGKVYVGAAVGQTRMRNVCEGVPSTLSCQISDRAGFKIFGGYQFTRHFALELGYHELGAVRASNGDTADLSALEAGALASWPLARIFHE